MAEIGCSHAMASAEIRADTAPIGNKALVLP
jgi:hypothetical protein